MEIDAAEHSRREVEVTGYRLSEPGGADRVGVLSISIFGVNLRVYYSVIGDQLYLATRRWLVDEMLARGSALPKDRPESEPGHLRLRIEHAKLKTALTAVQAGWGESMRDACFRNLSDLGLVAEATRAADSGRRGEGGPGLRAVLSGRRQVCARRRWRGELLGARQADGSAPAA